jgi:hypothetical protein
MRTTIIASIFCVALSSPALADDEVEEQECPLAFQGARVLAVKTPEGVALEFKNSNTTQLPMMRAQLRELAVMIEQRSTLTQTSSVDDEVDFPPVDLGVRNIAQGARVTVRAARLRDIPALRELAFGFAEFWERSPCSQTLTAAR